MVRYYTHCLGKSQAESLDKVKKEETDRAKIIQPGQQGKRRTTKKISATNYSFGSCAPEAPKPYKFPADIDALLAEFPRTYTPPDIAALGDGTYLILDHIL